MHAALLKCTHSILKRLTPANGGGKQLQFQGRNFESQTGSHGSSRRAQLGGSLRDPRLEKLTNEL